MGTRLFCLPIWAVALIMIIQSAAARERGGAQTQGAGEVKGSILFHGAKPHQLELSMTPDPVCASEQIGPVYDEDGQVNANGTLPNAFVYVKAGPVRQNYPPPSTPVILDQVRCAYKPHVLGIMVGQPLKVLNSDPTSHNTRVVPKNNRPWNITQEPGSQPFTKRFIHPEVMIAFVCNQHPWMKAYISVTSNPFYAVTGQSGTFTLTNLPPGRYTLEAATATFGTQDKQVTVEPGRTVAVDFTFSSPRRGRRPLRAAGIDDPL
jgi:plastocyanin